MSHFSVAVLSNSPEDVEDLLAPYCESTDDPKCLDIETADIPMEEMRGKYELEKENDESFSSFVERYYGYTYNEELNECGYLCNPNAKWDWYQIGGRWNDMLRLKPGCHGRHGEKDWCNRGRPYKEGFCAQAKLCDVDFSCSSAVYDRAMRFWEIVAESAALQAGESADQYQTFYSKEYYLEQFGDKHTYAQHVASFSTWAFITPDGEWHEAGQIGWFGTHDATRESRAAYQAKLDAALKSDPNLWITIVDCHI